MSEASSTHYLIHGAGAVGGTMAALLSRAGHAVTMIGRPALQAALESQGGLRFIEAGRESLIALAVVTRPEDVRLTATPVLFFTMKAGDLEPALAAARRVFPAGTLAVTWQNGIRAEPLAERVFPNLIGGVVRATSTMLSPGEVRIRNAGVLILGRYPPRPASTLDGPAVDREMSALAQDLRAAGYDAVTSHDIRSDKALKLLVNLFSGAGPLVRLEGLPAPNLTRLECNVLIEGARVLTAAGLPFEALGRRGDDVPGMLRHLRAREPRPPSGDRVHNSTWQNLHTPGRRLENDYMNGEILTLARRVGRTAPWNRRLLDLLDEVQRRGAGPGALTDAELGVRLADLPDPEPYESIEPSGKN